MAGTKRQMSAILRDLEQVFPEAETRLQFSNVFELLIATILSAQTTDEQVNTITGDLFKQYNTPQELAALSPHELEPLINGCGLFRNKARSIIGASQMILERFGGKVPDSMEELMKLPGVGRKTANVMLSVGFGKPGLAVDTHVQRVSRRLGFAENDNPENTELILKGLIPPRQWGRAHHLLIWHGRAYCQARKPKCDECPIAKRCPSKDT